jgi:hypothetical protein
MPRLASKKAGFITVTNSTVWGASGQMKREKTRIDPDNTGGKSSQGRLISKLWYADE